jgi:hypothetical protein
MEIPSGSDVEEASQHTWRGSFSTPVWQVKSAMGFVTDDTA